MEVLMRAFIAIEIPDEIKMEIAGIQEQLRETKVDASWPRPEGVHLTLKFLGEIAEARTAEIMNGIRTAVQDIGPFRLEVRGVGTFPNPKNARVVWIGLGGDSEKLTKLQAAVEDAMIRIGMAREERAFTPHLTVGRIKFIRSRDIWIRALDEVKDISMPGFDVLTVSLMKSELKPSGAVYTEMGKVELRDSL
jgi:RNA 2',3'-cyclic 3'-phosphodiesterase